MICFHAVRVRMVWEQPQTDSFFVRKTNKILNCFKMRMVQTAIGFSFHHEVVAVSNCQMWFAVTFSFRNFTRNVNSQQSFLLWFCCCCCCCVFVHAVFSLLSVYKRIIDLFIVCFVWCVHCSVRFVVCRGKKLILIKGRAQFYFQPQQEQLPHKVFI